MTSLTVQHVDHLDELLAGGTALRNSFPLAIGDTSTGAGVWRFFSGSWPEGGVSRWNLGSSWKSHWQSFLPPELFSFGEDVFGNQLVVVDGFENAMLWNHENGDCIDLIVPPCELLTTVLESGLDWIDFYSDGSLVVAKQHGAVPLDVHLHWTTPLILGGHVALDNLSLVQRATHLVGHGKLWSQISMLPPGATVIPRP